MAGFGQIVGLLVQLYFGFAQQRSQIHAAWHQTGQTQQRRDIVDIAVNAGPHAGILYLDG